MLQLVEPSERSQPQERERKVAIGIDLGTTHTVAALVVDDKPTVLKIEDGQALIPSAVSYKSGPVVGHQALKASHFLSSTKRLMGRDSDDAIAHQFPSVLKEQSPTIKLHATEDTHVTPTEVAAEILRYTKNQIEKSMGEPVGQAVITVPAYFDDAARAATKDAARLAGLQVLRLLNEPTAAALAYGLESGAQGTYAVYDLGGGTFDISLLKLEKGVFQVLATGGDLTLGGDDVDHALCQYLHLPSSQPLLTLVRQAKEQLSQNENMSFEYEGESYRLTRADVDKVSGPLVQKTIEICKSVIEDAGLIPQDIQGIVLVGGSTRLPRVPKEIETLFGKAPLSDIDPDQAVALGAALQAHGLSEGSDILLLDVIPLSLGLETMGDIVEKLLHRNTPIPTLATQEFTTYQDGQTAMVIHVVQGERELVKDCRSLARFELRGIPPMSAGLARIQVQFSVDADGLLTVSAQELTTGISQNVEVKPTYGLTPEDMSRMLEESYKHAQEDMERRLLKESQIEAQRLLQDVRTALNKDASILSSEEQTMIQEGLRDLEKALTSQKREDIGEAHQALEESTRSFAEKRINKQMKQSLVGEKVDPTKEALAS